LSVSEKIPSVAEIPFFVKPLVRSVTEVPFSMIKLVFFVMKNVWFVS